MLGSQREKRKKRKKNENKNKTKPFILWSQHDRPWGK